jgi:hypothetical protein
MLFHPMEMWTVLEDKRHRMFGTYDTALGRACAIAGDPDFQASQPYVVRTRKTIALFQAKPKDCPPNEKIAVEPAPELRSYR